MTSKLMHPTPVHKPGSHIDPPLILNHTRPEPVWRPSRGRDLVPGAPPSKVQKRVGEVEPDVVIARTATVSSDRLLAPQQGELVLFVRSPRVATPQAVPASAFNNPGGMLETLLDAPGGPSLYDYFHTNDNSMEPRITVQGVLAQPIQHLGVDSAANSTLKHNLLSMRANGHLLARNLVTVQGSAGHGIWIAIYRVVTAAPAGNITCIPADQKIGMVQIRADSFRWAEKLLLQYCGAAKCDAVYQQIGKYNNTTRATLLHGVTLCRPVVRGDKGMGRIPGVIGSITQQADMRLDIRHWWRQLGKRAKSHP